MMEMSKENATMITARVANREVEGQGKYAKLRSGDINVVAVCTD
jgi:hypothetical protein